MSSLFRISFSCLLLLVITACSVAPLQPRNGASNLSADELANSSLYQAIQALSLQHEAGQSGIYPITDALEAYSSRVLLVRNAQQTLDVQYYIWRKDNTGLLLLYELYLAAERGVKVRLLLDDLGSFGMDDWLAMLNGHPNIEVRIFNPFWSRKVRLWGFVTDFSRANRRMHNKSITADHAMSIVGGRNIGDEYFAATEGVLFADLDVLAIGPVAQEVGEDFTAYWQSQSAYPVEQLFKPKVEAASLFDDVGRIFNHPNALQYVLALQNTQFTRQFVSQQLPFEWVSVRWVSDNPAKGVGEAKESDLLLYQLASLLDETAIHQLDLVSPYFVPTRKGARYFKDLAQQGAEIRILTNSLAATDVAVVHSGYIKHRKKLLKANIELYEMKDAADLYGAENKERQKIFGSSGSSLHAKTFSINQRKVFVGSFNFDPRSARFNTESGFVIHSPTMAASLNDVFSSKMASTAYQLVINKHGRLEWHEQTEPYRTYTKEPGSSWFKRSFIRFLSWFPLDPLL